MPVLLRIAGLPTDRLQEFHSPKLAQMVLNVRGTNRRGRRNSEGNGMKRERQASGCVFCHTEQVATGRGEHVLPVESVKLPELMDQRGDDETIYAQQMQGFYLAYALVQQREHAALEESYHDRTLLFGAAFASQSLSVQLRKFKGGKKIEQRKQRRMELAWLSYLTRACCKPSPFSTFATVGMGLLVNGEAKCGLVPYPWKRYSLIRIKRYIIEQCVLQLSNEEEFLLSLRCHVNNTVHYPENGICEFLAPGGWVIHNSQVYTFLVESCVKMKLPTEVWEALQPHLDSEPRLCSEMIVDFQQRLGLSRSDAFRLLSQLRDAGLVLIRGPWASDSPTLERDLLKHLDTLPLAKYSLVRNQLANLCALEDRYASNLDPAGECEVEIANALSSLWTNTHALIPAKTRAQYTPIKSVVKHDSFLGCEHTQIGEVGYIREDSVKEALSSIAPLQTISNIFWPGLDFQLTVAAVIAERFDGCREIPLQDVLKATRSLWKEYVAYEFEARTKPLLKEPFNPLNIASVNQLFRLRARTLDELQLCLRQNEHGQTQLLDNPMQMLAATIPTEYRPILPSGLFIQPATRDMQTWVLNAATDGTGRIGSRYVHMMPDTMRQAYIQHSVACGEWTEDTCDISLLDVFSIFGEVLNAHPLLSRYVLEMPGERFEGERRLLLRDLYVSLEENWPMPRLLAPGKGYFLPAHLGGAGFDFVASSTVRQICMFGASRPPLHIPSGIQSELNGAQRSSRVVIGNLILRRECWWVDRDQLPKVATSGPDPDFYFSFNEWRAEIGIPSTAFVRLGIETDHLFSRHKPQYMDFSSPSFLRLLGSMIQGYSGSICFEEVLPAKDLFAGQVGAGHVFEVFVDPLYIKAKRSLSS